MKKRSKDELITKALTGAYVGASVVLIEMLGMLPAIMIRQITAFCDYHKHERDGYYWTYNSLKSWGRSVGESVMKVRYALNKLDAANLIVRTDEYNEKPYDRTLWYRVNEEGLREMIWKHLNTPPAPPTPSSREKSVRKREDESFSTKPELS